MNFTRRACLITAFALAFLPELSFGQYEHTVAPFWSNLRNPRRYEIGGGITNLSGKFTGVVTILGAGGEFRGDSTASRKMSGSGNGGFIGLNLPFKATGHISCWAVAVQLGVNSYKWADMNQTMSSGGGYSAASKPLSASTMQVVLPIGIDYKIGNDAILTKRLPFGVSLGAGLIPQIMTTTLPEISGFKSQWGYSCLPYAKFDLSMFTGFCWKIRVTYSMGNINLLDVNHKLDGFNDGPITLSSSSQLTAGIVIMPFSGGWREWAWYNTHDTYNLHDKFN